MGKRVHGAQNMHAAADDGPLWVGLGALVYGGKRDVVFEVHLPVAPVGGDSIATIECTCDPGMLVESVIKATFAVSRPAQLRVDGTSTSTVVVDDSFVAVHKLRMLTCQAMGGARIMADMGSTGQACRRLNVALKKLQTSPVPHDHVVEGLIKDLELCLHDCSSEEQYKLAGRGHLLTSAFAHLDQQPTTFSPAYQTPTSASMARRALHYRSEEQPEQTTTLELGNEGPSDNDACQSADASDLPEPDRSPSPFAATVVAGLDVIPEMDVTLETAVTAYRPSCLEQ